MQILKNFNVIIFLTPINQSIEPVLLLSFRFQCLLTLFWFTLTKSPKKTIFKFDVIFTFNFFSYSNTQPNHWELKCLVWMLFQVLG